MNRKIANLFLLLFFTAGTILALTGCRKEKSDSLHIGYFNNITHAQALYMKATGSLSDRLEHQTDITWTAFNAGPSEIEALFSGDIDIGYIGPVPAIMANIRSGGDITVLSGASSAGAVLIVSKDSGISSLKDLSGKTISIPQIGNTQHLCLLQLLKDQGLAPTDQGGNVTVTAVENADVQNLMTAGQIDAALVPEPWGTILEGQGAKVLLDYDQIYRQGDYPVALVVVREEYYKEHKDLVESFLKEHESLTSYMNQSRSETVQVIQKELADATGKSYDEQILNKAFNRLTLTNKFSTDAMEDFNQIALDQGFVPEMSSSLYSHPDE